MRCGKQVHYRVEQGLQVLHHPRVMLYICEEHISKHSKEGVDFVFRMSDGETMGCDHQVERPENGQED